ncbi:MAG: hypothetical protein HQL87_15190 [Magnetococcales bacterium]|nr:hypothetical protein [Magnetococcales bacterium]
MDQVTRRTFCRVAGVLGATMVLGTPLAQAEAPTPTAPANDMDALIARLMGPGPITLEKVALDLPATADNAALVRMPIVVDHPMEPNNFIQMVALFADNNTPDPLVAQFELTPEMGKAAVEFRARLAASSKVRVIARSNTGKLYGLIKEVQVATGGCAG